MGDLRQEEGTPIIEVVAVEEVTEVVVTGAEVVDIEEVIPVVESPEEVAFMVEATSSGKASNKPATIKELQAKASFKVKETANPFAQILHLLKDVLMATTARCSTQKTINQI